MKATFDREGLLSAVQIVNSVVPSRSPKEILTNIKLIAKREKSILMATDLDSVGVRLEVRGAKVDEGGEALLPTDRLTSILRECGDQELSLEADATHCLISGESSEFELPGEDPGQYPDVPSFEGDNYHQVQAGVLREMIQRTIFATAQENVRYAYSGVLWELTGEDARLVATDGRRLAVAHGIAIRHGKHGSEGQTPVAPAKAMSLLEKNLADAEEPVFVSIRPNEILFKTSRAEIYGRLVEGRFPPYREVFPKKHNSRVKLPVSRFYSCVRQAAIVTDEESRGVDFSFGKGKLTLQARVADKGRAKVEMPIEVEGKTCEITFNPRFLADMLRVLDSDSEITLDLVDGNSAALFKAGESYSYIVMPLARDERG